MTTTFDSYLKAFLHHLKSKKRSELTIAHYEDYLHRFAKVSGVKTISDISQSKIATFTRHLREAHLSPASQNYHLIAVRMFLRSLPQGKSKVDPKSISLRQTSYHPAARPSAASISRLLAAVPPSNIRDHALLTVLHEQQLTLEEASSLTTDSIDLSKGVMSVKKKSRIVRERLSAKAITALKPLLATRTTGSPLFTSLDRANKSKNKPLSARSIQRIVKEYALRAGLPETMSSKFLKQP